MRINVKRVYDKPAAQDGFRVLADRLWPRGVAKTEAKIDWWGKELTPSNELRNWFHESKKERYKDFIMKYKKELEAAPRTSYNQLYQCKSITLVTAVKDLNNSHLPTLKKFLENRLEHFKIDSAQ